MAPEFAGRHDEVSAGTGLLLPTAAFAERDPGGFDPLPACPAPEPLFPRSSGTVGWGATSHEGDSTATFSYELTFTEHSYPGF